MTAQKFPPRVWTKEVVSQDVILFSATTRFRVEGDIEYISAPEVEALLREERAKVWDEAAKILSFFGEYNLSDSFNTNAQALRGEK